ncbi:MAG: retention module-containing protein, partial [Pseudomonadota bacterium]
MALIGKVVSITGTAYLITENGLRRELSLGDQVQVGDAIETSRGAEVELELANGRLVNIHSEQLVQFTEELSEVIAPSNLDSAINLATIETVIKAIEEGKDVNAVLEETAAGQSGQYNSYGFSFVDLLRVNDILNAFNFAYDYEINQRADTGPLVDGDDNTYLSLPATSTPISGQISPTNNPPIAASVIANGAEDAASIAITLSGTDVDGTIASITLNNLPANGLLYTDATLTTLVVAGSSYVGSSATFYFVPNTNFNGNANFAYTVTDNLGLSSAAGTATITVALVNDAPTVNNDNIVVTEDTPVTGNVLTNDTDVDGNPLSVTQFTVDTDGNGFPEVFVSGITATIAGVGTVVINANGGFIFTPAPDYTGLIPEIIYTLSDGVLTDTGSLNLGPITPINDAPVAMDDIATTTINTPIDIDVKANDIDIDNITAQLTVSNPILTNSVLGTVSVNPDGTLHFEPAFNVAGPVEITYTLTDPAGLSDTATLTVNVGNNTSPTGANNTVAINEDAPYIFQGIDFGFNDIDAGQSLNGVRIDALPLSGALTLNGSPISAGAVISIAQLNAGQLRFVPVGDASDSPYASFTFSVQDNAGGFDTAPNTFTLNVTPVADITNDTVTTNEGTSVIFNVITGTNGATPDTFENPARAITSVTQGVNGTVSFLANGTITYTPNPNYFGGDSFTYTVTSGGITETASVNVTVNSVDDLPVAVADSINTNE